MLDLFQSAVNLGFFIGSVGIGYTADRWVPRFPKALGFTCPRLKAILFQVTQTTTAWSNFGCLDNLRFLPLLGKLLTDAFVF